VTSLQYQTHPTVLTVGSFESQRINGRNGLLMRVIMSGLVSLLWSGGLFGRGGRSELQVMERDEDSPRNGYTARSYIKILEEGLLPHYTPGRFFLQDNAKIHVAKVTKQWLESHGIWVAEHPPHSPDLNPIEHVWKAMKSILRKDHRYLKDLKDNAASRRIFVVALRAAWWGVPQVIVDSLIDSMPKRYHAVRRNQGWYTKY